MATEDPEFTEIIHNLFEHMDKERPGSLPVGTRHLIWAIVECAVKYSDTAMIKKHMEIALKHGYTPQQIIEALEVAVLPTGYTSFSHGYSILRKLVKERTN